MQLQALFNWSYTKIMNFILSLLHEKRKKTYKQNEYLYIHITYTRKYLPVLFSPISPNSPMGIFKTGQQISAKSAHEYRVVYDLLYDLVLGIVSIIRRNFPQLVHVQDGVPTDQHLHFLWP